VSAIGIAFAIGALVATAALRIPAVPRRAAAAMLGGEVAQDRGSPGEASPPAVEQSAPAARTDPDAPAPAKTEVSGPSTPVGGRGTTGTSGTDLDAAEHELRRRALLLPVEGVAPRALTDTFTQSRGGGSRQHEALDILAPRGTPVRAAEDGRIVKLFTSKQGGLTVYQFDPSDRFCYYYAHLDGYAPAAQEGRHVSRGEVIGYVGTTGNAPPGTPHLHFAVFLLGPERHWWQGTAIDPYPLFRE
jgi:murein DD-endopeptidase MepM/ murein hydrolase activator NlpD